MVTYTCLDKCFNSCCHLWGVVQFCTPSISWDPTYFYKDSITMISHPHWIPLFLLIYFRSTMVWPYLCTWIGSLFYPHNVLYPIIIHVYWSDPSCSWYHIILRHKYKDGDSHLIYIWDYMLLNYLRGLSQCNEQKYIINKH